MTARWLKFALIAYALLWFGIVVPGHQRGQITLPGIVRFDALPACCAGSAAAGPTVLVDAPRHGRSAHLPPSHRVPFARPCAICFFAAHLTLPPAIDSAHAPLGFLRLLPPQTPESRKPHPVHVPFNGRAPPAASA